MWGGSHVKVFNQLLPFVSSVYFSNMTESCTQIQQVALNALRGPNPPDYVATFGNTPVESVGDWIQILGINDNPLNVRII